MDETLLEDASTVLQDIEGGNSPVLTLNMPVAVGTQNNDVAVLSSSSGEQRPSQNAEPLLSEPTSHILFDFLYHATGRKYLIDFTGATGKVGYVLFWIEVEYFRSLPSSGYICTQLRKLYEKYIALESKQNVGVPDDLRESIKAKMSQPVASVFSEAQDYVAAKLDEEVVQRFYNSKLYAGTRNKSRWNRRASQRLQGALGGGKSRKESLTSDAPPPSAAELMRSPEECRPFKAFCLQEGYMHLVTFWLEVEDVKVLPNQKFVQAQAQKIYNKFLKPGCRLNVGLSGERCEQRLKEQLSRMSGRPPPLSAFDRAQTLVLFQLRTEIWPQFTRSMAYRMFLTTAGGAAVAAGASGERTDEPDHWFNIISSSSSPWHRNSISVGGGSDGGGRGRRGSRPVDIRKRTMMTVGPMLAERQQQQQAQQKQQLALEEMHRGHPMMVVGYKERRLSNSDTGDGAHHLPALLFDPTARMYLKAYLSNRASILLQGDSGGIGYDHAGAAAAATAGAGEGAECGDEEGTGAGGSHSPSRSRGRGRGRGRGLALLMFWTEVESFKTLPGYDFTRGQAHKMYRKFVRPGAKQRVVGCGRRSELRSRIGSRGMSKVSGLPSHSHGVIADGSGALLPPSPRTEAVAAAAFGPGSASGSSSASAGSLSTAVGVSPIPKEAGGSADSEPPAGLSVAAAVRQSLHEPTHGMFDEMQRATLMRLQRLIMPAFLVSEQYDEALDAAGLKVGTGELDSIKASSSGRRMRLRHQSMNANMQMAISSLKLKRGGVSGSGRISSDSSRSVRRASLTSAKFETTVIGTAGKSASDLDQGSHLTSPPLSGRTPVAAETPGLPTLPPVISRRTSRSSSISGGGSLRQQSSFCDAFSYLSLDGTRHIHSADLERLLADPIMSLALKTFLLSQEGLVARGVAADKYAREQQQQQQVQQRKLEFENHVQKRLQEGRKEDEFRNANMVGEQKEMVQDYSESESQQQGEVGAEEEDEEQKGPIAITTATEEGDQAESDGGGVGEESEEEVEEEEEDEEDGEEEYDGGLTDFYFYAEIENFKRLPTKRVSEMLARKLFDKYCHVDRARMQLRLPRPILEELTAKLSEPSRDLFAAAEAFAVEELERNFIPAFLESEDFLLLVEAWARQGSEVLNAMLSEELELAFLNNCRQSKWSAYFGLFGNRQQHHDKDDDGSSAGKPPTPSSVSRPWRRVRHSLANLLKLNHDEQKEEQSPVIVLSRDAEASSHDDEKYDSTTITE